MHKKLLQLNRKKTDKQPDPKTGNGPEGMFLHTMDRWLISTQRLLPLSHPGNTNPSHEIPLRYKKQSRKSRVSAGEDVRNWPLWALPVVV
jgi:hypothetical protein